MIVTGGTRGIGFAMAEGFVAAGAKVVIGSRDVAAVQSATAALSQQGGEVAGIAVNMGDLAAGQSLAEAAVANFGRIDVVVNNAATG